jgi:hypothetical protein
MPRAVLAVMFGLGLVACSRIVAREPEHANGSRALDRTLTVGTLVEAKLQASPPWRRKKPGETLRATVSANVKNARGWVVIPGGCVVGLRIARRSSATKNGEAGDANVALDVTSVTVEGQVYPLSTTAEFAPAVVGRMSRDTLARSGTILFVLPEGLTVETQRVEVPE